MALEKGEVFPEKNERDRIKLQTEWEQMFHGLYHYRKIVDNSGQVTEIDPLVPIPATISEITADLLFGEFPEIDFQNTATDELFKQLVDNNKAIGTDLLEAATYNSFLGSIFWHNFLVEGKPYYKFVKSNKAVWDQDLWGITNVKFFTEIERDKSNRYIVYHIQEHDFIYDTEKVSPYVDEGRKYRVQEYDIKVDLQYDNKIKEVTGLTEEITEWDFIPIIKVDNLRQMGVKVGKSDYQGKEQLFAEIDNRVDQINYVLQEHAEPWIVVPPGILNQSGNFNRRNGKMIERGVADGNGSDIGITSWEAQLESAFKQIETMIWLVFFSSRISAPIAGLDKGGQVESGRALKWKSVNTTSMIARKRKYWNEAFRIFFAIRQKIDPDFKNANIEDLVIRWQDGLPLDDEAVVENVVKQVQSGIMSEVTAIQRTQEVDEDGATKELSQIRKEQQDKATIKGSTFRGEV
jgi:hypothetical protein